MATKIFNKSLAPKLVTVVLQEQTNKAMKLNDLITVVCARMGTSVNGAATHHFSSIIPTLVACNKITTSGSWVYLVEEEKKSTEEKNQEFKDHFDGSKNYHDKSNYYKEQITLLEKKLTEAMQRKVEKVEVEVIKYRGIEIVEKGEARKIEGVFHNQFPKLVQLASARMNIMIFGPTGCGKSHVCKQLADALGLRFGFVSCTAGMSEGVITGKLLPLGEAGKFEYVISEFVDCFENGGVFLLDELDAADPNVLLVLNAALANGEICLSNRPENPIAKRHPDFVCIAAANTAGTNADRLYNGRNKLDGATLDRFQVGKVIFNYDNDLEKQICPDDALRSRCLKIRKAIEDNRLERAMSSRFMKDAYAMKVDYGWPQEDIDSAFFAGWREDERNKVKNCL